MITKEQIARINALARKQRENDLTVQEQAEQHTLRQLYLDAVRGNLKAQLDTIVLTDESSKPHHHTHRDCNCKHH